MPQPQTTTQPAPGQLQGSAIPRRYAVLIAAGTIVVMALCFGRDDQTRGPLWHSMWMLSLVVVLSNLAGSFARRSRGAMTTLRATKAPEGSPRQLS